MRRIDIRAIKGSEKLARDVYGEHDTILLPAGITLKKEYIEPLRNMDVAYIYIEDELSVGIEESKFSENEIKAQSLYKIRETLDRFSFSMRDQGEQVNKIAEEVMLEVLNNEHVIYNIAGVRQRSEDLYAHSLSVCALSVLLALKLNLPKAKIMDIAVGSILHDIGWVCVDVKLKGRGYETYSLRDLKEIKKHVIYGYNLVENATWLSAAAKEVILYHHEMCNGSGYPFRLDSDKIKIAPKIVALCDVFDSMVYGYMTQPKKVHKVIEYIISQSGIKFSHQVVKAFNDSVAAFPNGTIVLTSENELGIVLRQNNSCPTRPVIRIIRESNGQRCQDWKEKNLLECHTLFIVDTVETM